jgi:hypothetical protein
LQEEGGWYTYERSGKKIGLEIIKVPMKKGKLIKKGFPHTKKSILIINTMPGYLYSESIDFYEEIKKNEISIVNDVSGSFGQKNSLKGDFLIGSFGKDKPLTISTGGGFIALDNLEEYEEIQKLKNIYYKESGEKINFTELKEALKKYKIKKEKWKKISTKIKKTLIEKGFDILNTKKSINILVNCSGKKKENLIKFCEEHELRLQIVLCILEVTRSNIN